MAMTEEEWLTCSKPEPMLAVMRERVGNRKQRLCACAWVRRTAIYCQQNPPRAAVHADWITKSGPPVLLEAGDRFADGEISANELRAARTVSGGPWNLFREATRVSGFSLDAVLRTVMAFRREFGGPTDRDLCSVMRDICNLQSSFANADWLVWNATTIPKIAKAIYMERRFADMPILADALEEAGCDNADILNHCRSGGEHVRGCWVLDLLLAKE
jgi:hypothetical protein